MQPRRPLAAYTASLFISILLSRVPAWAQSTGVVQGTVTFAGAQALPASCWDNIHIS